jgi:hypothetical protein
MMKMKKMKHEIKMRAGHDCIKFKCRWDKEGCKPGAGGSHGIHGLDITFYATGDKGVVQFALSTGWKPVAVDKNNRFGLVPGMDKETAHLHPLPTDLGYHSPKPMYEGHDALTDKCDVLGGKKCYYDGSGLNANDAYYTLINGGDKELWKFLDQYYLCVFEDGDYPEIYEYPKKERR